MLKYNIKIAQQSAQPDRENGGGAEAVKSGGAVRLAVALAFRETHE